ncbi:unnamed protein product [Cunninghamella blakesleeana]
MTDNNKEEPSVSNKEENIENASFPRFIGLEPTFSTMEQTGDYNSPPADIPDIFQCELNDNNNNNTHHNKDKINEDMNNNNNNNTINKDYHCMTSPFSIPSNNNNNNNNSHYETTCHLIPTSNIIFTSSSTSILQQQLQQQLQQKGKEKERKEEKKRKIDNSETIESQERMNDTNMTTEQQVQQVQQTSSISFFLSIIKTLSRYTIFLLQWSSPFICIFLFNVAKCFRVTKVPAEKLKLTDPNDPNFLILPLFRRACWYKLNITSDKTKIALLYFITISIYLIKYSSQRYPRYLNRFLWILFILTYYYFISYYVSFLFFFFFTLVHIFFF